MDIYEPFPYKTHLFARSIPVDVTRSIMKIVCRALLLTCTPSHAHLVGKEGKMQDYTAHNCVSIVRMSGGPDEYHGCPYRRMDEQTLRANLAAIK
jgi:hypothetical protein